VAWAAEPVDSSRFMQLTREMPPSKIITMTFATPTGFALAESYVAAPNQLGDCRALGLKTACEFSSHSR